MLTDNEVEGCKALLRQYWHAFCDVDPYPEDFIENMDAAGLVTIRKVRKSDVADDNFAAERGIELGGWMWALSPTGRAALSETQDEGTGQS